MSPLPQQRVAILVDTANLYHSARMRFGGARVDYRRLLDRLAAERPVARAIAFVVRGEGVDVTPFTEALRALGFDLRIKVLRRRNDGSGRGDWDVGIAMAAVELASRVDCVILATGDGDLSEVTDHLTVRGVRVEVAAFPGTASASLIEGADAFWPLDDSVLLPRRDNEP